MLNQPCPPYACVTDMQIAMGFMQSNSNSKLHFVRIAASASHKSLTCARLVIGLFHSNLKAPAEFHLFLLRVPSDLFLQDIINLIQEMQDCGQGLQAVGRLRKPDQEPLLAHGELYYSLPLSQRATISNS